MPFSWTTRATVTTAALATLTVGCGKAPEGHQDSAKPVGAAPQAAALYTVRDTLISGSLDASGVAEALQQSTLSTKLMGSVTKVLVKEGDIVAEGQPLVQIDARDLSAKSAQVAASVAEAEAVYRDAATQARRMRALYSDSAASRAQLDVAETGLARAEASVRAAHAAANELDATTSYAIVRAPFAGIVTKRLVDPGAFAAPGMPLVTVQDVSQLRLSAAVTPDVARTLRRGQSIEATIEGKAVRANVEGVVPAAAGNLYTINALIPNRGLAFLAGSTASLTIPAEKRHALLVPSDAIVTVGDLTGVTLRTAQGNQRRWVRLGRAAGTFVEVSAGLRDGDQIVIPNTRSMAAAAGS